jgi:coenzyme F420-reducing hydrogenase alpha subunit
LARVNLNRELLFPTARKLADELIIDWPIRNPFRAIIARGLEIVHAYEEALEILRDYRPIGVPRVTYSHRAGEGTAATEAPRGTLYHRYNVDDQGKIEMARIIPPTSQNQAQIEEHMRRWVPHILSADEQETAQKCENLVRSYDPCISCSTHFLNVTIDRT